jgi:hypothetical protein
MPLSLNLQGTAVLPAAIGHGRGAVNLGEHVEIARPEGKRHEQHQPVVDGVSSQLEAQRLSHNRHSFGCLVDASHISTLAVAVLTQAYPRIPLIISAAEAETLVRRARLSASASRTSHEFTQNKARQSVLAPHAKIAITHLVQATSIIMHLGTSIIILRVSKLHRLLFTLL